MPKKKSGAHATGGKPPRAAGPQIGTKRPGPTSPQRGTNSKNRAVEAASSSESDGDGDASAPAPAASGPTLYKCAGCGQGFPQAAYTSAQFRKQRKRRCNACKPSPGLHITRKPARSDGENVTLFATIITKDGEKKSVPVPDDDRKRSVRVVHIVRIRTKPKDTPEDLIGRGWIKWLTGKRWPQTQWRIVDKATGDRLGACAMPISVSIDRPKNRATVELDSLEATLRKHNPRLPQHHGAVFHRSMM